MKKQIGIFYLLIAAILYAIMPIWIRQLGHTMPPFAQVFARYVVAAVVAVVFALWKKEKLKPQTVRHGIILIAIAVLGYGLSNVAFTIAILNTTITNALFLFFTFSIMTPLLAVVILKEKFNHILGIAVGLSLLGMYLMFRPQFGTSHLFGMGFALLTAFLTSVYYIGRRLIKDISAAAVMMYSTVFGALGVGLISFFIERSFWINNPIVVIQPLLPIIVIFGIDNFLAWLFLGKGLQTVPAGRGSIILLSELFFGVILGIVYFGEIPTALTLIGAGCIALSAIIVIKK